jgi:uncharacterized membrane protein YhdT
VSVYRLECLVVRGEEEANVCFAVPGSNLVGCGTVSTGKRRRSTGEKYCLHFWDWAVEGTLLAFSNSYYLFQDTILSVKFPLFKKTKRDLKCKETYIFSDYLLLLSYQICYYWIFFPFPSKLSFSFLLEKPSWSESFCVSIPLIFIKLRISVFQYYTCR